MDKHIEDDEPSMTSIDKHLTHGSALSADDKKIVMQRSQFALIDKNYRVTRDAAIATLFGAMVPVWVLYDAVNITALLGWYFVMVAVHVLNIALYFRYRRVRPGVMQIDRWKTVLRVGIFLSTFSYGCLGLFAVAGDPRMQIFILLYLIVISSAVSLGTSGDFISSVIGISSTLMPFVVWSFFQRSELEMGIGMILFFYLFFLLAVSFSNYRSVKKSTELGLINKALSEKLQVANEQLIEANAVLEQRVSERTQELQKALGQVTFQATHDIATKLPNQEALYKLLTEEIRRANQYQYSFGVACFSVNQAQLLIDTLGYQAWTTIIKTVADRLVAFCRTATTDVIRYTVALTRREVFAIIVSPLQAQEEEKVKCLFSVLSNEPVVINGEEIKLTGSMGVSVFPTDANAPEILLTYADATLFDSKKKMAADNLLFYRPTINAGGPRTIKLLSLLEKAFHEKQFKLYYQPVVDLKTGNICSLEALSRWIRPDLGYIPPNEFIPLVQNSKISFDYDQWVLHTTCLQIKEWHDMGFKDLRISVNLSEEFLKHEEMLNVIAAILKSVDLPADYLEIEFTESIILDELLLPNFDKLRKMGINVLIDDYGKGQGELGKIKGIPFSKIKIDKSFIQDVTLNPRNEEIVKSAIDLAKRMGMQIVAEGVETMEQLAFLRKTDCDMIQGFLFSEARPADKITEDLKAGKNLSDLEKKASG